MNVYIQSVLLGIVEGLTEFLPVSSTAHLRIAEAAMRIPLDDAYWKMYTIVIQAGAILALLLLYLERIVAFIKSFPRGESGDRTWMNHPISLTLIAFAFTSAIALPLHKVSEKHLGSIAVMAWALLIGGIVMWVSRRALVPLRAQHHARRRDESRPGHLDRHLPVALGHLPRHIALHVHHRCWPDGRARPALLRSSSASCSPSPR